VAGTPGRVTRDLSKILQPGHQGLIALDTVERIVVEQVTRSRFLPAALTINGLLGVLYSWSLFLAPLEALLGLSRAEVSVAPSVALFCVTVGVFFHDDLLRRLSLRWLVASVLGLAGAGHLLFWMFPTYPVLIAGYGVMFGLAIGVGFGVALGLARTARTPPSGWYVGSVAAMFAGSGMSMSAAGAAIGVLDPVILFGAIGVMFVIVGGLLALALSGKVFPISAADSHSGDATATRTVGFWCLFWGNFAMCYAGLMFISHGSALLTSFGLSASEASWAPFASNLGYVFGALFGGVVAAKFPGKRTPLLFGVATLLAVLLFSVPGLVVFKLIALGVVGAAFGSTVSVFMMLFTLWYGIDSAGRLFGRLNVGYGLAGFVAPSVTGWLFDHGGSYHNAVLACVVLMLIGCLAIALSPPPRRRAGLDT